MHARSSGAPRAVALVAIGLVVAASAVAVGLVAGQGAPAVPAAPWSIAGPLVVANLAVTRCATSYGTPATADRDLPAHVRAQVTSSLAHTVTVFTDGLGTLDVVAPSSWACTALDSVAGSSRLVVYPPGSPAPSWGHVTSVTQGIEASQTGSCDGCSLETACPLFSGAARAYEATYRVACGRQASAAELRTRVAPSTVLFVDPPGVLGAGQPSGGGNAAYGAMLWHLRGGRRPTAWLETCTLPPAERVLCVLSVRAFLSRHPGAGAERLS